MAAGILYPITITLTGASDEFATPDADGQIQEIILLTDTSRRRTTKFRGHLR
jgi:hypothetical protein